MLANYAIRARLSRSLTVPPCRSRLASSTTSEAAQPKARQQRGKCQDDDSTTNAPLKRKPGRPRKKKQDETPPDEQPETRQPKSQQHTRNQHLPSFITTPTHHHDLPTFHTYALRQNLDPASSVYKGTHYEYTVAATLRHYGFTLHRTGRSNDLGIDLVGDMQLPGSDSLRVLVQCKAAKPQPAMVRELEGGFVGAPAGWRNVDGGVLAVLVSTEAMTKGVREAVQRSRVAVGCMQVTREGVLRQFLWNGVAAGIGMEGLGVTVLYGGGKREEGGAKGRVGAEDVVSEEGTVDVSGSIALTWMGRIIRRMPSEAE